MTPHGSCPGCAPVTATCKREVNIWYINPHQRKHTHTQAHWQTCRMYSRQTTLPFLLLFFAVSNPDEIISYLVCRLFTDWMSDVTHRTNTLLFESIHSHLHGSLTWARRFLHRNPLFSTYIYWPLSSLSRTDKGSYFASAVVRASSSKLLVWYRRLHCPAWNKCSPHYKL